MTWAENHVNTVTFLLHTAPLLSLSVTCWCHSQVSITAESRRCQILRQPHRHLRAHLHILRVLRGTQRLERTRVLRIQLRRRRGRLQRLRMGRKVACDWRGGSAMCNYNVPDRLAMLTACGGGVHADGVHGQQARRIGICRGHMRREGLLLILLLLLRVHSPASLCARSVYCRVRPPVRWRVAPVRVV